MILIRNHRWLPALLAALLAGSLAACRDAPGGSPTGVAVAPVTSCAALKGVAFPAVSATATGSAVVTDTLKGAPVPFCEVSGTVDPGIGFVLKLPTAGWHGQYVQEGCGAFCGTLPLQDLPDQATTCPQALSGELALGVDDEGHQDSDALDASWAADLGARTTFGQTSEHLTLLAAESIMARYYGRPPVRTYYDGCSSGGREALTLAQRYPDDFNGIVAGAPAGNAGGLALFGAWVVDVNTDAQGHEILTSGQLPALHDAVALACGNAQGVIPDPRWCDFDPAWIACPPGAQSASCLTPAQVAVARELYRGPLDASGKSLSNGGEPYGSELAWDQNILGPASDPQAPTDTVVGRFAFGWLGSLGLQPGSAPGFQLGDVTFTAQEFTSVEAAADTLYNANDPDLRAFARHGGRLIVYQGWADQDVSPWSTLDYYAAVERRAGGFGASQRFSRLYVVPGGAHCLDGLTGAATQNQADFLGAVIDWVERGTAPGTLQANTVAVGGATVVLRQRVSPYDALAPVASASSSLNGSYDYIGTYRP